MAGETFPLAPDPFAGRTMGKYEVICRLSTGGMSEIFLAFQRGLAGFRKIVVLKCILPDIRGEEEFIRMFLDEAKITAAFNHPNIAQVFDLDVDEGQLFLAMEFVPGCTLVELARACRTNNEPIPTGFSLMAVRDTALALHYAHTFTDPLGRKQTVIHRDVAEKNIMVTYEGTTKLLDFGIAKSMTRAGRTTVGMVKGTSGYMSPEQILGEKLDARSDIFSLGVVLHECLTGMRLFHGKSAEDGMMAALREEVAPPSRRNPEVTPELDAVVLKALARKREDRYSSALELARALERAAGPLLWHPEQSGALIQRLFGERRAQTQRLLEQARPGTGEITGELQIVGLLDESPRVESATARGASPSGGASLPFEVESPPPGMAAEVPTLPPRPAITAPPVEDVPSDPGELTIPAVSVRDLLTREQTRVLVDEVKRPDPGEITAPEMHIPAPEPRTHPGREHRSGGMLASAVIGVLLAVVVFTAGVFLFGLHERLPWFTEEIAPVEAPAMAQPMAPAKTPAPEHSEAPEEPDPPKEAAAATPPEEPKRPETAVSRQPTPRKPAARPSEPKQPREHAGTKEPSDPDEADGPGLLSLVTDAPAKVLFKAQLLGSTPLSRAYLPAGRHTLRVIGEDDRVRLLPVVIRSNKHTDLKVSLGKLETE